MVARREEIVVARSAASSLILRLMMRQRYNSVMPCRSRKKPMAQAGSREMTAYLVLYDTSGTMHSGATISKLRLKAAHELQGTLNGKASWAAKACCVASELSGRTVTADRSLRSLARVPVDKHKHTYAYKFSGTYRTAHGRAA